MVVANLQCNNKLQGLLICYNDNSFTYDFTPMIGTTHGVLPLWPFMGTFEDNDEKEIRLKAWNT